MYEVFSKAADTVKPAIVFSWAVASWVMFPEKSYIVWCVAVWSGAGLDLLTRWYAIFRKNGGVINSIATKAWNSEAMFNKTFLKIISYLAVQILAGLSMRFISIPVVSNIAATGVYVFLFFREFASNIENLIEAGADYLKPLLFWVKKQEKKAFEEEEEKHEG